MTNEFETVADETVTKVVHDTVSTPTYTTTGYTTGTTYASTPTYTTATTPTYTTSYTTAPTYTTTTTAPSYQTVPLTEYPAGYDHNTVATHYATQPTYTNYDPYGSQHHYHHTDGLALGALIASIAGLTILPVFGSIVGIILGILALHRLRLSGHNGHGMAMAGIVLGALGLLFGVLLAGWLASVLGHTTGYVNPVTTYPYVVR